MQEWGFQQTHGNWYVNYNGYGYVRGNSTTVEMATRPVAASAAPEAGLVTSVSNYTNVSLAADVTTTGQMRSPSPNFWERAWLIWGFQTDGTYYSLILTDMGWQVNKRGPSVPGGEMSLKEGSSPKFPVGAKTRVRITQSGSTIRLWLNGSQVATINDDKPYTTGKVGLFTFTAAARFDGFDIRNG